MEQYGDMPNKTTHTKIVAIGFWDGKLQLSPQGATSRRAAITLLNEAEFRIFNDARKDRHPWEMKLRAGSTEKKGVFLAVGRVGDELRFVPDLNDKMVKHIVDAIYNSHVRCVQASKAGFEARMAKASRKAAAAVA